MDQPANALQMLKEFITVGTLKYEKQEETTEFIQWLIIFYLKLIKFTIVSFKN